MMPFPLIPIDIWTMILIVTVIMVLFAIIIIGLAWTPAATFFMAKVRKRNILFNPMENRFITLTLAKSKGPLAETKNGFYAQNLNDFYLESRSKVPMAVVFSTFARTIDIKKAAAAEKLKEIGIKNWRELKAWFEELKAAGKDVKFNILGQTVDVSALVDYFGKNERSDLIEAEIQRRTAAERASKGSDYIKYLIPIGIMIFLALIGLTVMMSVMGDGGNAAAQAGAEAAKRVLQSGGTGIS